MRGPGRGSKRTMEGQLDDKGGSVRGKWRVSGETRE